MPGASAYLQVRHVNGNSKENRRSPFEPLLEGHTPSPKRRVSNDLNGAPSTISKKVHLSRAANMVQAVQQPPKAPVSFGSMFNGTSIPKKEDNPSNKLKQLSNITVTICPKTVKEEFSQRHLSMSSPPSSKASRSYLSDASDEYQHKAKKFKRADIKEPHLVGFKNQGGTCYLNSLLQALSGVESFYAEVLHELPIMSSQLCALQSLFRSRNEGRENMVYMCLQEIHARFAREVDSNFKSTSEHQDLEEFLTLYLDKIDSQIKQTRKELDYFELSPTLVETNFPFKDTEKRICKKCQNEITSEQTHNILYVSLMQEDATNNQRRSVQELVESTMEGPWNDCENCKEFNSVKTTKKFKSLPKTLLIILMRYDKHGQKLETPVDVCPYLSLDNYISSDCCPPPTLPLCISKPAEYESIAVQTDIEPQDIINPDTPETDNEDSALKDAKAASLVHWSNENIENQEAEDIKRALEESIADMDPFQYRPDSKVIYRLSAVVNHYGETPNSGHYKCDVFRKEKMQWYNYNDLNVRSRSPEKVLKCAEDVCYLLVYQLDGQFDGINVQQERDAEITTVGYEANLDTRASPEPHDVKDFESTSTFLNQDFS